MPLQFDYTKVERNMYGRYLGRKTTTWRETNYFCMFCGQQPVYKQIKETTRHGWESSIREPLCVCISCGKTVQIDLGHRKYYTSMAGVLRRLIAKAVKRS